MPRLADVVAGRASISPYRFTATAHAAETSQKPKRAQRRFAGIKLTVAERREFLDAYGPVLSLEKAAEIAGVTRKTLKKQLSQGKYADCVKRKKPIRFITDRFIQELFGLAPVKFHDRQVVEGTEPTIYIGHRVRTAADRTVKVSPIWYAEYCLHNRQRFEALGTSNKSTAIQKAHAICMRIQSGQPDRPKQNTMLKQIVDGYLELMKAQGRAPTTITKYDLVGRNVLAWSGDEGRRRAATLMESDFWSIRKFLVETEGVGDKTAYDRLVVVKQMLKWAARQRLISASPFAGLAMTKPESPQQPCFMPDQTAKLLEKADAHFKPVVAMLAYAGLRFGEARDLLWTDLVLDNDSPGFIVVRRGGSSGKTTKGRRQRRIPIHVELRRILDSMARPFDRIFTALLSPKHPNGGAPLNERRCLVALKRLCKRCGFANHKQYKLHTFRHTFASMCARNNVSYKYALDWMGHRSSDILDLYYTMFDADAHAAMKTLVYPSEKSAEILSEINKSKKSRK